MYQRVFIRYVGREITHCVTDNLDALLDFIYTDAYRHFSFGPSFQMKTFVHFKPPFNTRAKH